MEPHFAAPFYLRGNVVKDVIACIVWCDSKWLFRSAESGLAVQDRQPVAAGGLFRIHARLSATFGAARARKVSSFDSQNYFGQQSQNR